MPAAPPIVYPSSPPAVCHEECRPSFFPSNLQRSPITNVSKKCVLAIAIPKVGLHRLHLLLRPLSRHVWNRSIHQNYGLGPGKASAAAEFQERQARSSNHQKYRRSPGKASVATEAVEIDLEFDYVRDLLMLASDPQASSNSPAIFLGSSNRPTVEECLQLRMDLVLGAGAPLLKKRKTAEAEAPQPLKYKCDVYNKAFARPQSLGCHRRTHSMRGWGGIKANEDSRYIN